LTAPELTVRLVELNEATPTVLVVAFATEITPVAEIEIGVVASTATVPELLGKVMVLTAEGEVRLKVRELAPEVPNTKLVPM